MYKGTTEDLQDILRDDQRRLEQTLEEIKERAERTGGGGEGGKGHMKQSSSHVNGPCVPAGLRHG